MRNSGHAEALQKSAIDIYCAVVQLFNSRIVAFSRYVVFANVSASATALSMALLLFTVS